MTLICLKGLNEIIISPIYVIKRVRWHLSNKITHDNFFKDSIIILFNSQKATCFFPNKTMVGYETELLTFRKQVACFNSKRCWKNSICYQAYTIRKIFRNLPTKKHLLSKENTSILLPLVKKGRKNNTRKTNTSRSNLDCFF